MAIPDILNYNSLRISFGRFNTLEQADYAADVISGAIERARSFR
jgi:cysteine sulfinate desulfinase/cysteine desulfurase-like protein